MTFTCSVQVWLKCPNCFGSSVVISRFNQSLIFTNGLKHLSSNEFTHIQNFFFFFFYASHACDLILTATVYLFTAFLATFIDRIVKRRGRNGISKYCKIDLNSNHPYECHGSMHPSTCASSTAPITHTTAKCCNDLFMKFINKIL